jgi:hypothetical protein
MMRTRPLKVALLGCGVVGSEVARIMTTHAADLAARIGAPVELAGVAVRRPDKVREGIDPALVTTDATALVKRGDIDVVVEVIGGIEPARTLITTAFTLYEVGTVKPLDGLRTYVSVDGGMSDNIRTALYDAEYSVALVSRASDAEPMLVRVVGKHCESGDIVVKDAFLPGDLAPGDLIAVPATGAYCRSMASNYNHVLRPPVVAVRDGAARVIVRRETEEDLLRLDVG